MRPLAVSLWTIRQLASELARGGARQRTLGGATIFARHFPDVAAVAVGHAALAQFAGDHLRLGEAPGFAAARGQAHRLRVAEHRVFGAAVLVGDPGHAQLAIAGGRAPGGLGGARPDEEEDGEDGDLHELHGARLLQMAAECARAG